MVEDPEGQWVHVQDVADDSGPWALDDLEPSQPDLRELLREALVRPAALHRPGCHLDAWLIEAANGTCDCGGNSQYLSALALVEALRLIHRPVTNPMYPRQICEDDGQEWPCKTAVRALGSAA